MAILEEKTKAKYGYYSSDIGAQSKKTIVVTCEKCGKIREIRKDAYPCLCSSCAKKGKKLSEEHKRKISKGGKGLKRSEETRHRISESTKGEKHYNYGKHPSEETRRKLSEARRGEKNPNYGKHYSKERLTRMSTIMKGKNNPNYGKHKSEETKRKMSEARKGTHPSEETRRKLSEAHKNPSEEICKKISEGGKGRICSKEARKKMSEAHKGKKHWNWQDGVSFESYCQRFNFALKEEIREKYDRKCYLCGKSEEENGQRLSVHHIDNEKMQGCEDKSWFLIPLCRSCHMQLHANEKRKQKRKRKDKVLYLQKPLL